MTQTDYDVILGGVKAKTIRGDEGYKHHYVRKEIAQNLLSQADGVVLTSREDRAAMYQSDWTGGARWWIPLLSGEGVNSYYQSHAIDAWTEPGKLVPANKFNEVTNSLLHEFVTMASQGSRLYAIGTTNTTNATYHDVYQWTPSSDTFVRETAFHSGIPVASADPRHMLFDPSDGYFYVFDSAHKISRFITGTFGNTPASPAQDAQFTAFLQPSSGIPNRYGASLLVQRSTLMIYDGDALYNVDKGDTVISSADLLFSDGLGRDILDDLDVSGSALRIQPNQLRMSVSTPEGIYYVKNTRQNGQPQAWVFRVEKNAAGSWIGNPITTLPLGFLALSIQYHLGSVVISGTPQAATALNNDDDFEVIIYHITQGGMGAVGSVLGPDPADSPYHLLTSQGDILYFSGRSSVWVWDAVRGGIHRAATFTSQTDGTLQAAATVLDSNDVENLLLVGSQRWLKQLQTTDDLDTTNYLYSNYFDGNLPMELKHLTRIEALVDPDVDSEPWEVFLYSDGGIPGMWTASLTTNGGGVKFAADVSSISGYHFGYKVEYNPGSTGKRALRALVAYMTTGQIVQQWDLMLDGRELLNVDNEVQDEQAFHDALAALMASNGTTTLVDNMQEQERLTDSATTTTVKIKDLEIIKSKAGESTIHVVVVEQ